MDLTHWNSNKRKPSTYESCLQQVSKRVWHLDVHAQVCATNKGILIDSSDEELIKNHVENNSSNVGICIERMHW